MKRKAIANTGFMWNGTIDRGKRFLALLSEKRYTTLAGTLVFFLVLSLLPFLFWLFLIFKQAGLDSDEIIELEIFDGIRELLYFFRSSAQEATSAVSLTLLVTTLYSSTNLFYHLRRAGELIFDYKGRTSIWKTRLISLAFLFGMILYCALTIAVCLWVHRQFSFLPKAWREVPTYIAMAFFALFLAFFLNLYMAPYRTKGRRIFPGCLVTLLLWVICAYGFGIYLSFSGVSAFYGTLAAFIVFLLWLYIMTCCFLIGVVFNRARNEKSFA
ncbi:MAG: YihY/virulence factor BrkB family protein [Christensenellaceae bacterium]